MSPSPMQILVIALIILLLFGASRLGDVGKGLGEGIRNFKKGVSGDGDGDDSDSKSAKQLKDKEAAADEAEASSTKPSTAETKREEKA